MNNFELDKGIDWFIAECRKEHCKLTKSDIPEVEDIEL